jgi:peptidoglycan/xylan/chitin deacetylase (PgdA/CDA1 family)
MSRRFSVSLLAAALALAGCESTPVLLYHSVGEAFDPPRFVTQEEFREQMLYLTSNGFTVLTAKELADIQLQGKPAPAKAVCLTFDDGHENFYLYAYQVLRELGLKATMFLISSRVADDEAHRVVTPPRELIWPEVQEMQAYGIDFESHSVTHPHLRGMSSVQVKFEVEDSKAGLEAKLGVPVEIFAYPNGSEDRQARSIVADSGYRMAFSVSAGLNGVYDRQRISIHEHMKLKDFARAVAPTWWGAASGAR